MVNENKLWPEDAVILDELIAHPHTDNERAFFSALRAKMENELAPCKEVHFSEKDNSDAIFLLRDGYDEFIIGTGDENNPAESVHVMSLSEALNVNLKDAGFINRNLTLLEWLRERDYKDAMFDHNNAYM